MCKKIPTVRSCSGATSFLAANMRVGVRVDYDKECDCVRLICECIHVPGHLRLGFEMFPSYARLFGMSVVSSTCCTQLGRQ